MPSLLLGDSLFVDIHTLQKKYMRMRITIMTKATHPTMIPIIADALVSSLLRVVDERVDGYSQS
jgi:hypothetical protein